MLKERVIRLTREELYRRVWEQPMRTVAQEIGISDVALAKACRKANIPVPGRGFWAQKAAGKRVRLLPLPTLRDSDRALPRTIEFALRPDPAPPAGPVAEQVEFESLPENRIEVPGALRSPHPLIKVTLEALDRSSGARHDGYLANWQVRHLDVEVSKLLLRRALRILDAVVKAFEERGWEVSLGREDHNSYVTIRGQRVPFGIREPRRQVPIPAAEKRSYDPKYREEPSGRLALVLREYWGRSVNKSIAETGSRPLESRLNDFMTAAVALAHERAEWERSRQESEERRRKEELARQEAQRRREAVAARVKALEDQAERWSRSRIVREYAAAVRTAAAAEGVPIDSGELAKWLEWAEAHAREIDPVEGKVREFDALPDA